jgi:hypothetical protein
MPELKVKLLPDEPTNRDEFKSHGNVAQTITTLISGDAEGGKAIGITGSWGSGKSTVIEIVKHKLSELRDCQTLVFQFDAWAHQDDPPRRAFLEALHQFLQTSPQTKDEVERLSGGWKQTINKVVGKSEISTTTTQKEIAPVGALIAILLLITVPLAGSVANKTRLRYGFLLVLLPVLVAAVAVVIDWWRRPADTISITTPDSPQPTKAKLSDQMLRVLLRETQETKTSETEKAEDATSTDFRRVFSQMLAQVLVSKNRRLIVVVDNLDRVDAQKAISLWSTMRIFFELDSQPCEWKSKFWLIAPFDPAALRRLWAADTPGEEAGTLVESFVNKTFQVTFRVSPPVAARWRDFFEHNFRAAFLEEKTRSEWPTVYRLYDRFTAQPSFRDIKLFINKLAMLYLQWEDQIPLAFLTLYLLIAPKTKDNVLDIITGRPPGGEPADSQEPALINAAVLEMLPRISGASGKTDHDGWKKQIAAVHFNVAPSEVVHALIGNELQQALAAGDSAAFKRLAQVPDFWTACEKVIEDRLPDLIGTPTLLTTLRLLYDVRPQKEDGELASRRVIGALVTRAVELEKWDFEAVSLVNDLLTKGNRKDYRLFKKNVLSAARHVDEDADEVRMHAIAAALDTLRIRRFRFETAEPTVFVRINNFLIRTGRHHDWQVRNKSQNKAALPLALADFVVGLKSGDVQPLVGWLLPQFNDDYWESLRRELITRLSNQETGLPQLIEAALAVPFGDLKLKRQVLASLAKPAVALAFTTSVSQQDWQAAAFCGIALFHDAQKAGDGYGQLLQQMANGEATELYQAFLDTILRVEVADMLLTPGLEQPSTRGVAVRAISDLSRTGDGDGLIPPHYHAGKFVSRYGKLRRNLARSRQAEIISILASSSDILDVLCRPGRLRVSRSGLYRLLMRTPVRPRLTAYLLESILASKPSDIARSLRINDPFRVLFLKLLETAGTGWLSSNLASVLTGLDAPDDKRADAANAPAHQSIIITDLNHTDGAIGEISK